MRCGSFDACDRNFTFQIHSLVERLEKALRSVFRSAPRPIAGVHSEPPQALGHRHPRTRLTALRPGQQQTGVDVGRVFSISDHSIRQGRGCLLPDAGQFRADRFQLRRGVRICGRCFGRPSSFAQRSRAGWYSAPCSILEGLTEPRRTPRLISEIAFVPCADLPVSEIPRS